MKQLPHEADRFTVTFTRSELRTLSAALARSTIYERTKMRSIQRKSNEGKKTFVRPSEQAIWMATIGMLHTRIGKLLKVCPDVEMSTADPERDA